MEFQKEPGRIYALGEDGTLLAEITFPTGEDGVADIDHTFVDESLRGQGVASQLVRAAAAELRAQGKRAKTSCWYAAQWFEKHPQEQDLLYKDGDFKKCYSPVHSLDTTRQYTVSCQMREQASSRRCWERTF